jgi:prepilin-type N-terminal cleavage/methylation domain-containing protein
MKTPGHRGFTLVEVLLSLAVLAVLLAAVATAVYSSIQSNDQNQQMTAASQTARLLLERMMTQVRSAKAVDSTTLRLTITDPQDVVREYELSGGALLLRLRRPGQTVTTEQMLSSTGSVRLSTFSVLRESPAGYPEPEHTRSVTIRMVIKTPDTTLPLTASAAVRRNQAL